MTLPERGNSESEEGWVEEGLPERENDVLVYLQVRQSPTNPDYIEKRKVTKNGQEITVVVGPMAFRKKSPPDPPQS